MYSDRTEQNSKVSIILPVYNGEEFLQRAISSVLEQTYTNFELLVINDGGNTIDFFKELYKSEERIIFFEKDNGGISSARNYGLERVTGDYITFIDQDDMMEKDALSALYHAIKATEAEIVIGNFCHLIDDIFHFYFGNTYDLKSMTIEELYRKLDDYSLPVRSNFVTVWGTLFKKELFNDIRFPVNELDEDGAIIWKLYRLANRIVHFDRTVYIWRHNTKSVSTNFDIKQLAAIKHREERLKFMMSQGFSTDQWLWAYKDNVAYFEMQTRMNGFLQEAEQLKEKLVKINTGELPL